MLSWLRFGSRAGAWASFVGAWRARLRAMDYEGSRRGAAGAPAAVATQGLWSSPRAQIHARNSAPLACASALVLRTPAEIRL